MICIRLVIEFHVFADPDGRYLRRRCELLARMIRRDCWLPGSVYLLLDARFLALRGAHVPNNLDGVGVETHA